MGKMKNEKLIKAQLVYAGVSTAAKRLGCSREHLSRVLHGAIKPSETLARKLRKMGLYR